LYHADNAKADGKPPRSVVREFNRPRRSFDLRDGPLMEQLTKPERAVVERAAGVMTTDE